MQNKTTDNSLTDTTPLCLDGLLDELDRFDGAIPPAELQVLLNRVALCREDIRKHEQFSGDCYQRVPIRRSDAYEALLLCWVPGQASPIHDHHGSGCGVLVVHGTMHEQCYDRLEDGTLVPTMSNHLTAGQTCVSVDSDIHIILNESTDDTPLLTLHIYTPPLATIGLYDLETKEKRLYTYPASQAAPV